jgi:thioredoxin 1
MSVVALTTPEFDATIGGNDIVVVDFWAPWCGPCKAFAPVFEQVAGDNTDVKFVKVNTDEEGALAGHFGIRSIPTLIQQPGALSRGAVEDVLRQVRELDMVEVKRGSQPHAAGDSADEA